MSVPELYANYDTLKLTDKILFTLCVMYDLDVGDYSADCENRDDDWFEAFDSMRNHLENALRDRVVESMCSDVYRIAKPIIEKLKESDE